MTEAYNAIVKFFQEGGIFLFPISLAFVIGLAIAVERWIYLASAQLKNRRAFERLLPKLEQGNLDQMQALTTGAAEPILRIIGCGIDMLKVSPHRADVESAMSEGMLETLPQLEKRTHQLAMLANIATLLGLLGTIIGLISAFTAVANADPAEKSTLLSLSISVAMNTTAMGLISAIPLLVFHSLLKSKTNKIVNSIEMAAVKFLNVVTLKGMLETSTPRQQNDA